MGSSTERVEKALTCIANRGYFESNMTALDIGSGTGTFTLSFAQRYKEVTSLDISSAMQNVIRQRAAVENLTNIHYMQANWRDIDIDQAGMREQYDLVLCSINPRGVCNYESKLENVGTATSLKDRLQRV